MMTEPTPAEARQIDDVIEEARREEVIAERRTELLGDLVNLGAPGREAIRIMLGLAQYAELLGRESDDGDEVERCLDLIDEATARSHPRADEQTPEAPAALAPDVRHDLGTDFRGLTATAGALATALGTLDEGAQVWMRVRPEGTEYLIAIDALTISTANDGSISLIAPNAGLDL